MTATEALAEEGDHEDFDNGNESIVRGHTTRPRYQRRQRRWQRINDGTNRLATITECQFSLLSYR